MSKLSKFKSVIPMVAATKLLSDLIGEKVDVNDLMSLYEGGWLRLFRPCHGEIVKLKPIFDAETHEQHARDGRYFMESDYLAGVSYGFYLPCDSVQIASRKSYAVRDANGGLYAIRDIQTDEYLSPHDNEDDPDNVRVMAVTADLYSLAEKANMNAVPEKPTVEIMANDQCILIDQAIFNFAVTETQNLPEPSPTSTQEVPPPSLRITVAALLEAATSERKNHTQTSLIESILERNKGIRGLSESSLQKHFSDSNAELTRLRKTAKI
jgi:hypothetical protein